jgi:hypothetical protein
MTATHQTELAAFLFQALREHGVEASLEGDFVGLGASGMTMSGAIFSQVHDSWATAQLDVGFDIGPGRTILESCGGFGATLEDAVANAKEGFVDNALHVLLAAFCGVGLDQVNEERWELQGGTARVVIGNVTGRGKPPEGRMPVGWFPLVEAAAREAKLGIRTHWVRVYCARTPDGDHTTEVLLDNEHWPELAARIAAFAWPPADDFYSARVFLVLDRGFDTSRAVAVMHRMHDRPDEEIVDALVALGAERRHAIALVDFLPIAFGRPVLEKLGVRASETGQIQEGGSERTLRLLDDPVFADAAALANEAYAHGTMSADVFRALALRGAELGAVNEALSAGSKAADLELSPPMFRWG